MRHERSHTKVIATLGPASSNRKVLTRLFEEGVDVCRLNFSHGSHEDHLKTIELILDLNRELNSNVAIMADLQGPKLRIGLMQDGGAELVEGQTFDLVAEPCTGNSERAYMSYHRLPTDVKKGEIILVDDGKIQLEVMETNGKDRVRTKVINGGILSSKKGVNLPHTRVSLPSMTEKDVDDARFAIDHDVDWLALSFVRNVEDVTGLKKMIEESGKQVLVVAKIEKPEALDDIDNIIDAADAIMVARGDLGVEVDFDQVPLIQKSIVSKCINKSKPVIIATQMMESMIENPTPTRAEATDVANAVLDGADTLMLSGETSVGKFPDLTIRNMQRIIDFTEAKGYRYYLNHPPMEHRPTFLADSVCYNAAIMAEQAGASAIISLTHSGYTAFRISSYRPKAPIFAFTMNPALIRHLSLVWGVRSFYFTECFSVDDYISYTNEFLLSRNLIRKGDLVVHVGSIPILEKGKTNMIKLSVIE
ncbi:MAG: pyruvate kinase [Bacteroidota bacterium]